MPNLQANSNVIAVIPAGATMYMQGQGTWQFVPPQPASRTLSPQSINGIYGFIGPFDVDTSVLIQSGGAPVAYEIIFGAKGNTISDIETLPERIAREDGRLRTVLFGDSMTDLYEQVQAPLTSLSYDKPTGVLTIGFTAHQQATGWFTTFWDRAYDSLRAGKLYQVTRIDANTLSINIGANLPDVPNGTLPTGAGSMRPQSLRNAETFVTWLNYVSGNKFDVVYNGAQSGDDTRECLARIWDACLDWNPDVVIMQLPGINDSGDTPLEVISANQKAIIDLISDRVRKLVLLTTTPVAAGEVRATLRIMERVVQLNNRIKDYVKNKPNVLLFDAHCRIVDPTNATGLALVNFLRTSPDLIHYSMRGGKFIADQLWAQIGPDFLADRSTLPLTTISNYASSAVTLTAVTRTSNVITATSSGHGFFTGERAKVFSATGASELLNDWVEVTRVDANTVRFPSVGPDGSITGTITLGNNNNLMPNPLLTGAGAAVGGGITGVYATGLSAFLNGTPTCAGSLVARADGRGQNQRTVVTFAAANDRVTVVTNITDILRHIRAGRSYVLEAEVSLTGVAGSNLSEIRFNLAFVLDGVTYQTYALAGYTSGATLNSDSGVLYLRTPPLICPQFTSATQARMDFTLRGSAAGTALTADIGLINFLELEGA